MRPNRTLIQVGVLVVASVYIASYAIQGLPTSDLFAPIGAAVSAVSLVVLLFDQGGIPLAQVGITDAAMLISLGTPPIKR